MAGAYNRSEMLAPQLVLVKPEVQAKLDQMARDSGRQAAEVIEDAVIGLYDELAHTRELLDSRYDDLKSGRVTPISGDDVKARLHAKSAARRAGR